MKKTIISFSIIAITLFLSNSPLFGQEQMIKGLVTMFDSIPLIGATIKVKSTQQEFLSDTMGLFTVLCNPDDRLRVSANGFVGQRVKLNSTTKYVLVNLRLKSGDKNREYAIGYVHVKDKYKLFAISSWAHDQNDFSNYQTMYNLINANFSAVEIVNGEIIIRGSTTYSSAGSAALIIIDGIQSDEETLFDLNPKDVQRVDVLKDASAAMYGIRGANGVVIVETKIR